MQAVLWPTDTPYHLCCGGRLTRLHTVRSEVDIRFYPRLKFPFLPQISFVTITTIHSGFKYLLHRTPYTHFYRSCMSLN